MDLRPLGATGYRFRSVALGCWPMAGMSTPGVDDAESLATILACFDLGINFLDTAFAYGMAGESERMIARALAGRRDEMVIATKGGIEWERRSAADRRWRARHAPPAMRGKPAAAGDRSRRALLLARSRSDACRLPNRPAKSAA